jgi:tetratricopeptide (TPR) repeat protein
MICAIFACTPKTAPVSSSNVEVEEENEKIQVGPCTTWHEYTSVQREEISDNYVIYRDYIRIQDYETAYEIWKGVFSKAPMADGGRRTLYEDGLKIYNHFINSTEDIGKKKSYLEELIKIYDQMEKCIDEPGYISGRKAFDFYYKYPTLSDADETFRLFKKAIDTKGDKSDYFIINPFTSMLIDYHHKEEISLSQAQKYTAQIKRIIQKNLDECETPEECEPWKVIKDYAPQRLVEFEGVRDFYDCTYYQENYYSQFQENPEDCDIIRDLFARLKWGGCSDSDPLIENLRSALNQNCIIATEQGPLRKAYNALEDGDFELAVQNFLEFTSDTEDSEKKAKYLLIVAKIYYGNLKDFRQARKYALRAAGEKSGWGEPYILIGKLYASSGPLCGTGRGFNSQRVVWPAIDKWQHAKRIDSSVSSEANRLIGQYSQYMPDREILHQMLLEVGASYRVPCWIQENTTIRAARK